MNADDRRLFAGACIALPVLLICLFSIVDLHTCADWAGWLSFGLIGLGLTANAQFRRNSDTVKLVLAAAQTSGDVIQLPDGRAGVVEGLSGANHAAGDTVAVRVQGEVTVQKTSSIVLLDGGKAYWDHSAEKAHFKKVNDQDFFLGSLRGDAASADTTCVVDLNVHPCYLIDLCRDPFDSVIVNTKGSPQLRYLGGAFSMELTNVDEAQKVDALSKDAFAVAANAIVEFAVEVVDDGDAGTPDFNIGVANATHASDADSITEACFIHLDGNDTTINAESDDGDTEVAATDTTKDYTLGTRFEGWMDLRNPADIQVYVDGVLVLSGSTFKLDSATGPLKLCAHLEKSGNDTIAEYHVDWLRARIAQQ